MADGADLGMGMPPDMNAQDDIEKIMNEIENMREDMKTTVASTVANKETPSSRVKAPTSAAAAEKSDETEIPQVMEPGTVPEPVSEDDDSGFLPEEAARALDSAAEDLNAAEDPAESEARKNQGEEAWLEETYANLRDSGTPMSEVPDTADGSLTLLVQGSMTVRLRHERTGQEVGVSFVGDSIHVYLADGAELTIPVKMKKPAFGPGHGANGIPGRKKRAA